MHDPLLTPDLLQAGARYVRERAPDPVTLEWLKAKCATLERVLRIQYPEGQLPGTWERDVALLSPVTDTSSGLRLKSLLEHFYRVRNEGLRASGPTTEDVDAAKAARALLRREPIVIQIAGESVAVTGRSYSAMMEIAAHELRIREYDGAIERVASLAARTTNAMRLATGGKKRRQAQLRRRLARLNDAYRRIATEREAHRCALYAHATTAHGGPAADPLGTDAPTWWRHAGPLDDAALLGALFLAGPARIAALPEPTKKADKDEVNEFGWASLFAFFERRHMLDPARGWDTDLGQVIADVRVANAPFDEMEA